MGSECSSFCSAIMAQLIGGFESDQRRRLCLLKTPFYLADGSRLTIVVERLPENGDTVLLSDDGLVAEAFAGLATPSMWSKAEHLATRHGIERNGDLFQASCAVGQITDHFWELVQTCLEVGGLLDVGPASHPRNKLIDDLNCIIEDRQWPYEPEYELRGQVDDHEFTFGADCGNGPVVIQTLQANTASRATQLKKINCWEVTDVRDSVPKLTAAIILDDSDDRKRSALRTPGLYVPLTKVYDKVLSYEQLRSADFEQLLSLCIAKAEAPARPDLPRLF